MRRAYKPMRLQADRLDRIGRAAKVIDEYERRGIPMSLRQLYYQLVARGLIENTDKMYGQLGDDVSEGRMTGLISWTSIEDRGRNLMGNYYSENPGAAIKNVVEGYRTDKWANQPVRPEVWVEKAALEGVVGTIASSLDVDYFSCRGYNSQSEQWRAGRRIAARILKGQRTVIIHLGDHDPSGLDMTRDNQERLSVFAGTPVQVLRIALNMPQVERYRPPPNPAKITDSRFETYRRQYGDTSWELDALAPEVIQDLIREAVMAFRDNSLWELSLAEENLDRARLTELCEEME